MTPTALMLVLLASVFHATWNMFVKSSRQSVPFIWLSLLFGTIVFAGPFLYWWDSHPVPSGLWPFIVATGIIHGIYFGLLSWAYESGGDLSTVYPVARGSAPLLVAIGAVIFLNETPSLLGLIGILVVVAGIFITNLSEVSMKSGTALLRSMLRGPILLALLTGLSTTAYSLIDKAALRPPPASAPIEEANRLDTWVYLYFMIFITVVFLAPMVLYYKRSMLKEIVQERLRVIPLVGILCPCTYGLILIAFATESKASYIVAARQSSILFAALLGTIVLREKNIRQRVGGAVLIAFGVACLAMAT